MVLQARSPHRHPPAVLPPHPSAAVPGLRQGPARHRRDDGHREAVLSVERAGQGGAGSDPGALLRGPLLVLRPQPQDVRNAAGDGHIDAEAREPAVGGHATFKRSLGWFEKNWSVHQKHHCVSWRETFQVSNNIVFLSKYNKAVCLDHISGVETTNDRFVEEIQVYVPAGTMIFGDNKYICPHNIFLSIIQSNLDLRTQLVKKKGCN